jgi:branched-subunit amino acid aminotransferase/4-amino-4-deoxychorismate lyase
MRLAWTPGSGLVDAASASWPVDDPAITLGWSVFETLDLHRSPWEVHLQRLAASCEAAEVPFPGQPALIAGLRALAAQAHPQRVRITASASGRFVLLSEPLDPQRRHRPVRAKTGPASREPILGGAVKHASRCPWAVALRRSGVDEVLLVDHQGRFTEGTTSGILAVIGGVLYTAPFDGAILESTTTSALVDRAVRLGVPVVRAGAMADSAFDALYIASATRGLAPVVELDGRPMPGWDPVGRRLIDEG